MVKVEALKALEGGARAITKCRTRGVKVGGLILKMPKEYAPLTPGQVEDRIRSCPEGSDDMFWRQDELVRIAQGHRREWENKQEAVCQ